MPNYVKGRLRLEDFNKIPEYNEVDMLNKIKEILHKAEKASQKVIRGNKTAMVDLRKLMNDNINLSFILRDMVSVRRGDMNENRSLKYTIEKEKKAIAMEDKKKGVEGLSPEEAKEKVRRLRLAEQIRKDELKQKIKEIRAGAFGRGDKKATDQL